MLALENLPTALDLRDDLLTAAVELFKEDDYRVLTATANKVGLIYLDGEGPIYTVEVTRVDGN